MIAPIYENLSKDHPDVIFSKIDIDEVPEAADDNDIRSVPTFQFWNGDNKMSEVSTVVYYITNNFDFRSSFISSLCSDICDTSILPLTVMYYCCNNYICVCDDILLIISLYIYIYL